MGIDYNKVSFISRSPNRKRILQALINPKTPTQLSKELKIDRGYASKILIELTNKKLVKCLSPDETRHRLYKIADEGIKILDEANKLK